MLDRSQQRLKAKTAEFKFVKKLVEKDEEKGVLVIIVFILHS